MNDNTSSSSCSSDGRYHVIICASKDIKGLLACNMADQFFTPKNVKLTFLLGHDRPKSENAKLAGKMFGYHEYSYWFGNDDDDNDNGYLGSLNTHAENQYERRNVFVDHNASAAAFSTFEEMQQRGIQVTVLEKSINHSSNMAMLQQLQPDVILSARFLHIFKAPVIAIPRHGIWNMHPGALPAYRGLHVDMRTLMHQHNTHLTMTAHQVDTGIDTGAFLDEYHFPRDPSESLLWHRMNLHLNGLNMLFAKVMKLSGMMKDDGIRKEKDYSAEGESNYYSWPSAEEYKEFDDLGLQHYQNSDMEFVKGLFDKRLPNAMSIQQEPTGGMFYVAETTTTSSSQGQEHDVLQNNACMMKAIHQPQRDNLILTQS